MQCHKSCGQDIFLTTQGYGMKDNVDIQDNKSAMLLEKNGTASSSKRMHNIVIRFFFVKDRVAQGQLNIEYCPMEKMTADFFTKPLQGSKVLEFRKIIIGEH